jgi:anti-sigma regulatory factor (Ser/Thr protein kinase)
MELHVDVPSHPTGTIQLGDGRNVVVHGGGGEVNWTVLRDGDRAGLRLTFRDHGPGIPDLQGGNLRLRSNACECTADDRFALGRGRLVIIRLLPSYRGC